MKLYRFVDLEVVRILHYSRVQLCIQSLIISSLSRYGSASQMQLSKPCKVYFSDVKVIFGGDILSTSVKLLVRIS